MNIVRRFIILPAAALAITGCSIRSQTMAALDSAETLMQSQPDSALTVLHTIDAGNIGAEADRARYALLYSQAIDKNHIRIENDSLISIAVAYYEKHGDRPNSAWSYYYLGRVQANALDTKSAGQSFLKSKSLCDGTNDYLLGLIYSQLGNIYEDQNLFADAISRYEKSLEYFENAGLERNVNYTLGKLAMAYLLEDDTAKAEVYYVKSAEMATRRGDTSYAGTMKRGLAILYLQEGDIVKSKKLLREAMASEPEGAYSVENFILRGKIHIAEGRPDSAQICYDIIDPLVSDDPEARLVLNYGYYETEQQAGDPGKALEFYRRYTYLKDSLEAVNRENSILETEKKYRNELLRFENYKLRTTILLWAAGFAVVCLVAVYLFLNRRNTLRKRGREIEELLGIVENISGSKQSLLSTLSLHKEKERRLKELLEGRFRRVGEFVDMVDMYGSKPKVLHRKLQELVRINSQDNLLADLREIMDERYNGAISHLEEQYPSLTEDDVNLCCLICAGFTVQQMCTIYDFSGPNSIYVKKRRLKKKLALGPSVNLDDFLAEMVTH